MLPRVGIRTPKHRACIMPPRAVARGLLPKDWLSAACFHAAPPCRDSRLKTQVAYLRLGHVLVTGLVRALLLGGGCQGVVARGWLLGAYLVQVCEEGALFAELHHQERACQPRPNSIHKINKY